MKWTLQFVFLIAMVGNLEGQELYKASTAQSGSPVNIALDEVNKIFVAPPRRFNQLKSASTPGATIKVTYNDFPAEAKRAFEYAVSIWESLIVSPVPIHVEARWDDMSGNVMAKGAPSIFFNNFGGTPLPNTYYPVALAEKISGKELNPGNPDIVCDFSSKIPWYFGTDGNTPSNQYDFVSSVLHEITHGLGFSGFFKDDNGKGFFNNNNNLPSIYDYFLFNIHNQQIANKSLFQSPSADLHKELTSDNLKFCQTTASSQQQTAIDWVFAPPVWNEGSSIYHLKGYDYGDENGLMTHAAKRGEAIHHPGEITLAILSELGWKSVSFDFEQLRDLEETVAEVPLEVGIVSDADEDFSIVRVIYSTDNFATAKVAVLEQKDAPYRFSGKLLLENQAGEVKYYIEAKTPENRKFRHPAEAPVKMFAMNIGPDHSAPNLLHNQVKVLAGNVSEMNLSAGATDNLGIKSVTVEYKINGILQEPLHLTTKEEKDLYAGVLQFPNRLNKNDRLEYRITAEDNSSSGNKSFFPETGFHPVKIYSLDEPVTGYSTNFEGAENDFIYNDFTISAMNGFSGKILHTNNPYPVSALETEKYNLTAQLKYPVIIQPGGQMSFNEVVLVEPGEPANNLSDPLIWDYVVVEASKDGGQNWIELSDRYDSGINDTWYSAFTNSFSNNSSTATPHESMFVNHTINLTQNTGLESGDTVIFRFRMASDISVNGFGWAIGNLEIQDLQVEEEELFAEGSFQVYPNPANNHLFVEWREQMDKSLPVEIIVTDLFGKTVRHESGIEPFFSSKTRIDLSGINPGIYMVSIRNGMQVISTNKIVKN